MESIDITYFGRTVRFPDLPRYRKFYQKLAAGTWEPATFRTLAAHLGPDVTFIDIGGWIGATPFWASGAAKRVIALEPDPACLEVLESNAPGYPNVTIIAGALAPEPRVTLHGVGGFGSSESSVLPLDASEVTEVPGIAAEDVLARAGPGPIFLKVDIEGFEYAAFDEIAKFAQAPLVGAQIAIHPHLYERSLHGPAFARRLRTVLATWRFHRLFADRFGPPFTRHARSFVRYCLFGVLLRRVPKHTDLVYSEPRS
jgi:FkbM family methyltransferase